MVYLEKTTDSRNVYDGIFLLVMVDIINANLLMRQKFRMKIFSNNDLIEY